MTNRLTSWFGFLVMVSSMTLIAGCENPVSGGKSSTSDQSANNTSLTAATATPSVTATPSATGGSSGISWQSLDIGSASGTTSGTASLTIGGKGKFESSAQTFRYVYTTVSGDFTMTARLDSYTGASSNQGWAGLLFTPVTPATGLTGTTLTFGASVKRGDNSYNYGYRLASGDNLTKNTLGAPSGSGGTIYLKLSRTGNAYGASYSLDGGTSWGTATTASFTSLPTAVSVGFAVNSGSSSASATAVFSDIKIVDGSGTVIGDGGASATPTPTPTATPVGQTPTPSPVGQTPTPTPAATPSPSPATTASPLVIPTPPNSSSVLRTVYVATSGSASGDGSSGNPLDLLTALAGAQAGDRIVMKAGTYAFNSQITIDVGNDGTASAMKQLVADTGASVVLDFSSQPYGSTSSVSNPRGLQINANYWYVWGLEVMGSADNGIYIAGNHNIIEACTLHANRDSGLQLGRANSTLANKADWPSYNLILNCESYDNYDLAPNSGENADGFACKLTTGPGNVFKGCIAHNNIDDGWDLFTKTETGPIDPVVIDQCIAFNNGTLTNGTQNPSGDKNGFKLGGSDMSVIHVVTRSIAFGNGKNGFTWNSNPGAIRLVNNLAWDNAQGNFKFDGPGASTAIFFNNFSFWVSSSGQQSDRAGDNSGKVIANNIFWDKSKKALIGVSGVTSAGPADIQSKTLSLPLSRNSDGSFVLGNFGKLASGSQLVNAGVTPSIPADAAVPGLPFDPATYYVGAPDLGAIEQ